MYEDGDDRDWVENLKAGGTWARGAFVVFFLLVLWFVRILVVLLAALQFSATLITGRPVARALPFGRSLSGYIHEIALFVTYNYEQRPWPWSAWPEPGDGPGDEGFTADDEEPRAKRKSGRRSPTANVKPDDTEEETAPPSTSQADEPPEDGGDDADTQDGGSRPPRGRKRKAETARDGDEEAESSGEPPRPDA